MLDPGLHPAVFAVVRSSRRDTDSPPIARMKSAIRLPESRDMAAAFRHGRASLANDAAPVAGDGSAESSSNARCATPRGAKRMMSVLADAESAELERGKSLQLTNHGVEAAGLAPAADCLCHGVISFAERNLASHSPILLVNRFPLIATGKQSRFRETAFCCPGVARNARRQADFLRIYRDLMVGGTGIEPVTPRV